MTLEEKRVKIAEACGYHSIDHKSAKGLMGMHGPMRGYMMIPDYFADLNAMHQAEKVLTREQWSAYYSRLDFDRLSLTDVFSHHELWPFHSTAAQRAEAFGLTLGLWKKGE